LTLPVPWMRGGVRAIALQWRVCLVLIGATTLAGVLVFAYLWLGTSINLYRQEVARATLSLERLHRDVAYLEHQVELALRPDEILQRAQALGMVRLREDQIVKLSGGG